MVETPRDPDHAYWMRPGRDSPTEMPQPPDGRTPTALAASQPTTSDDRRSFVRRHKALTISVSIVAALAAVASAVFAGVQVFQKTVTGTATPVMGEFSNSDCNANGNNINLNCSVEANVPATLSVKSLDVAFEKDISGEVMDDSYQPPVLTQTELKARPLVVGLSNDGDSTYVIDRVSVKIPLIAYLGDCTDSGGGPGLVTGRYTVLFDYPESKWFPPKAAPLPGDFDAKLNFAVAPRASDMMSVFIGPKVQRISNYQIMVFVAQVSLWSYGGESLPLQNAVMATTEGNVQAQIMKSQNKKCAQQNLLLLKQITDTAGSSAVSSPTINQLEDTYKRLG